MMNIISKLYLRGKSSIGLLKLHSNKMTLSAVLLYLLDQCLTQPSLEKLPPAVSGN